MTKNLLSITSLSDTLPATVNSGRGIATRMAENLLDVARSQERGLTAQQRHNLGDYECEQPKYLSHEKIDGQVDNGIDLFTLGAERACVHINAGIRNFSDYARAMTEEIGDQIQPYLLCFWEAARRWPGLDVAGMTNPEDSSREYKALLNRTCALKQTFDEEIYNKARPLFQQAIANIDKPSSDLKEAMRAVVQMVLEKSGAEAAHNMKPYVVRFISEQQSPVV